MDSFEAKDGENDGTPVDRGEKVGHSDHQRVLHTVLVRVVVRSKTKIIKGVIKIILIRSKDSICSTLYLQIRIDTHSGIIFQLGYNSGHIGNHSSTSIFPIVHLMWPRIKNQKIGDLSVYNR